jgi:hypothetical protein
MFKRSLHDSYRRCADEHVEILTFDSMVDLLMLWERNYELREGQLPNQVKFGKSKPQVNLANVRCSYCHNPGHVEEKCWIKHPELKPAKFSKSKSESNNSKEPFKFDNKGNIENIAPVAISSIGNDFVGCNIAISKPKTIILHHPYNITALLDTCASCSMITPKQATYFLNHISTHTSYEKLNSPIVVQFGNEGLQNCNQVVHLRDVFQPDSTVSFLVVPSLCVPILVGNPDIERFSLLRSSACLSVSAESGVDSSTNTPLKDLQFFRNSDGRLVVSNSVFENANIFPWKDKPRSHSETDLKIMDILIDDMISKNQVRKVTPDEVTILQELILVDKFIPKGILKPRSLPIEPNRYRLCLDSRPANALRLDNSKSVWLVNNMLFGGQQDSQTNEIKQSQKSALKLVESIPRNKRMFYGKLDIHNAFYSIFVTKGLSRLFGFRHRDQTYAMMVLPMGWFLSPGIFQDAVSYVLDSCKDSFGPDVSVVHQQDDILITATSREEVKRVMDVIVETLSQFGLTVRNEKCEGPSDSLVFCGLKLLPDSSIKPAPAKRQLNELASDVASDMFSKAKTIEDVKHVLRSWLGTSNFYSKWLPGYLRSENLVLHSLISKMDSNLVSIHEVKERSVKFVKNLCNWWLNDSIGLFGGSDTEDTLVVVDANKFGWSGVIFRLVEVDEKVSYPLPFSISGLLESNESLIPEGKDPSKFTVIPVRLDGDRWRTDFEISQSSTWRERCAAITIIHQNRDILTGNLYLLSDNKNLVGNWKDYESLNSFMCNAYLTYISHVNKAVHVKRAHPLLQWVDQIARGITELSDQNILSLPVRVRDDDYN